MAGNPFITARLFSFLKDLKKNNNRDWFADNKDRFENDVREPLIDFIAAFSEDLYKISKHLEANTKKVGGSLFRIYRDVRFSKDKSPYKTNVGVHFRHEDAKDAHAPGYYLHLEPGEVFFAAGIWHPDSGALKQIRSHIVENSAGWKRAIGGRFKSELKLEGDSLSGALLGSIRNIR